MKRHLVCLAMLFGMLLGQTAAAATFGPFQDFKAPFENHSSAIISGDDRTSFKDKDGWILRDVFVADIGSGTDLVFSGGVAWETLDEPDSGNLHITTMYGVDLNPLGTDFHMTGFDAAQTAAITIRDETFIGDSGTLYHGVSLGTPTLGELPALFPGFDLSLFAGNPSSVVYTFRTTVPRADLSMPEPSSVLIAAIGCIGLSFFVRRLDAFEASQLEIGTFHPEASTHPLSRTPRKRANSRIVHGR